MSLREKLAELEHVQWAHWTSFMLEVLHNNVGGGDDGFCIQCGSPDPEDHAEECHIGRWMRQIETPYSELSEKEKDSDREWADKVLEIVKEEKEI